MKSLAKPIHHQAFAKIAAHIEAVMHVDIIELTGPHRSRRLGDARALASFALYEMGVPYPRIAMLMCRDHSTVCHHVKKFRQALKAKEYWARVALESLSQLETA